MFAETKIPYGSDKSLFYQTLTTETSYFLNDNWLTNLSNASAFLMSYLPQINWAGFYLYDGSKLVLGPFQGKPACLEIHLGKGVCGTAAQKRETVIVPDVELFPGHIACDGNSRSEIVLPMISKDGKLLGVLDIDSPIEARFSPEDAQGLQLFLREILSKSLFP